MEALGLYFRVFFEIWIFDHFTMFYSTLNIDHIRIFENTEKYMIWSIFEKKVEYFALYFWIFFRQNASTISNLKNVGVVLFITTLDQKLQLWAENRFSDFPDFGSFSLMNSLRKIFLKEFIKENEPKSGKSENRFSAQSCNFWSRVVMNKTTPTFFKLDIVLAFWRKKIQKYNAKYSTFFSKIDQIMYFSVFSKIRIWSMFKVL